VPIIPGRIGEDRLSELVRQARGAAYSYPAVGATRSAALPAGYAVQRISAELGEGEAVFERAAIALDAWEVHRGAGLVVVPAAAPAAGETVAVVLPVRGATVVCPCRIVYVTDEPDRSGFAYGTLPGHPERGEEAFHVQRSGDRVRFEIVAFSRPAHPLARIGASVARRVQAGVTERYVAAMQAVLGA
jgi:uncharacterized protein (UPF0548 family)